MDDLQLWISALEIGSFYGLIALCYLIVYQGALVFNFAIGGYAMVAGIATSWLATAQGAPTWAAMLFGLALCVGSSVMTELVVVRPMVRRSGHDELPKLIAVTAVLFALEQGAGAIFGRGSMPGQSLLEFEPIEIGTAVLDAAALQMFVVTAAVFAGVALWLNTTPSGRMLRAAGDNPVAAQILGLPTDRIRLMAFLVAGLIAAVAGIVFALKSGITFRSALPWSIKGFLAAVIGGTGAVWAPLAGGILLGAVEVFVPYYLGGSATDYVILILAAVFFVVRPQGIFARRVRV